MATESPRIAWKVPDTRTLPEKEHRLREFETIRIVEGEDPLDCFSAKREKNGTCSDDGL